MKWRWTVAAFLAAFAVGAMTAAAMGQEVIQDSVTVTVLERPEIVVLQGPGLAYRGDRLTYMARALDPDGNPTLAFLVWSVSDTSKARIVSLTDSTATVETLATGTFVVRVQVGPLDSLRVGFAGDDGTFAWEGQIQIGADSLIYAEPWEEGWGGPFPFQEYLRAYGLLYVQACALFYSGDQPWGFSGHEICYPAYAGTFGAPDAPAGPLYRLAVYGAREPLTGGGLTLLAALIRSSPPADRVALRRMLL